MGVFTTLVHFLNFLSAKRGAYEVSSLRIPEESRIRRKIFHRKEFGPGWLKEVFLFLDNKAKNIYINKGNICH